jgi:SAM-dependent methyltransferase
MSRVYGPPTWALYRLLDESLSPRGPDWLLDLACGYLARAAAPVILDAGCREARDLIQLVARTPAATGVGIDPVQMHVKRAEAAVACAGLAGRISVQCGELEQLPFADESFDLIWCRDVLEQVFDLEAALHESARMLQCGGRMIVFTVFATELLEAGDARMLAGHLANVPANLDRGRMETAFAGAGLAIEQVEEVGAEWREYAEERTQPAGRALLRLARLRRQEAALAKRFGRDIVEHVQANLHWEAYQLLGKLQPVCYVLRKP